MATIWDDLKAYWQKAGVALPKRSGVIIAGGQPILQDGPGRVDMTPQETSGVYIWSTVSNPGNTADYWLCPYGIYAPSGAPIYMPVPRRTVVSEMTFHFISTQIADSVQVDLIKKIPGGAQSVTGLTLTVPANATTSQFFQAVTTPVAFEIGDQMAMRLRQSSNAAQVSWNAYICVA